MATVLTTYDPKEVIITWNGIDITKGIAPDTFISISRAVDAFTPTVGAEGTVARTRNANRMGNIEITLMQNSPVNNLLAAQALLDEQAGAEILSTLTISDPSGSVDFVLALQCWIKKIADADLAGDYGDRTWQFDSADLTIVG